MIQAIYHKAIPGAKRPAQVILIVNRTLYEEKELGSAGVTSAREKSPQGRQTNDMLLTIWALLKIRDGLSFDCNPKAGSKPVIYQVAIRGGVNVSVLASRTGLCPNLRSNRARRASIYCFVHPLLLTLAIVSDYIILAMLAMASRRKATNSALVAMWADWAAGNKPHLAAHLPHLSVLP